jgi:type I restriction enzyme S subunit
MAVVGKPENKSLNLSHTPGDWETGKLDDFLDLITYGFTCPMPTSSSGPLMITAKDLVGNRINARARRTTKEAFDERLTDKSRPRHNDILLSKDGTLGRIAVVGNGELCINQSVALLRPNKKILPMFLYYLLLAPQYQKQMEADSDGTVIRHIYITRVNLMKVAVPLLIEQQAIADFLLNIDRKIELNQRMNETLEAIGQAVFRRWFVDFEFPNQEGKPYKTTSGKMADSELGEIPSGWAVTDLTEIARVVDCLHSKKPQKTQTGSILLQVYNIDKSGYLDLSDPFYVSDDDYKYWTRNIEVKGGDCAITNAGRVGAIAQIPEGSAYGIGRNMTAIIPTKIHPTYLFNYLASNLGQEQIHRNIDTGTILDSLNVKGIIKIKVILPPQQLLHSYELLARPFRKRIEINNKQNTLLSETRDRLLPKLMSGKIRVPVQKEGACR